MFRDWFTVFQLHDSMSLSLSSPLFIFTFTLRALSFLDFCHRLFSLSSHSNASGSFISVFLPSVILPFHPIRVLLLLTITYSPRDAEFVYSTLFVVDFGRVPALDVLTLSQVHFSIFESYSVYVFTFALCTVATAESFPSGESDCMISHALSNLINIH